MCATCKQIKEAVKKNGSPLPLDLTETFLDDINNRVKQGASYDHFQKALDELMDTKLNERNPEKEGIWEDEYRNG